MTPEQFVEKYSRVDLPERAISQEHFIDLCRLIGQPTPAEADATGEDYCFEKHVKVVGSASKGSKGDYGFVDVWKRGHFAWEYKRKDKHKTLDAAYRQVYQYRDDLDNPPLSVVCDIRTTEIRAHFPGYPTEKTVIKLEEIPGKLDTLRRVFTNPHSFKPLKTREQMTGDLAKSFGDLADKLLSRNTPVPATLFHGHGDPVAHFLMKVMFCLFAEDVGLLPDKVFTKLVDRCMSTPEAFKPSCAELFEKMKRGGHYGNERVDHFNGGLFDDAEPLSITHAEMPILLRAAGQQWGAVEPSIFGTLFERILDPDKRAQIGAHYTSKADILLVVEPVVMAPLRREWSSVQERIAPTLEQVATEKDRKKRDLLSAPVRVALTQLREHLGKQRILDPACGSGNFLYVALQQLLDLDDEIVRFAARYDIALNPLPYIRPTQLHGIEINPYAAELAQVVIWIGYLQWIAEHRITNDKRPILDKLTTIDNTDAILDMSKPMLPTLPKWPEADFVIGNPPFLGSTKFEESGIPESYKSAIERLYGLKGKVDLCCYWFEHALRDLRANPAARVGLLGNTTIRFGVAREPLDRISSEGTIFNAWANRKWVQDGADVRVCIACFGLGDIHEQFRLDSAPVAKINADLTASVDVTVARRLKENKNLSFEGDQKGGPFELKWDVARKLLSEFNPVAESNSSVLRPRMNANDVTRVRWTGGWVIDFGVSMELEKAALFAAPFKHLTDAYAAEKDRLAKKGKKQKKRKTWWLHKCARPKFRAAASKLQRFLVTGRVATHRIFAWLDAAVLPDSRLFAFARDDDYFFGVLQSSIHERWALAMAPPHGVGNDPTYSATMCFETFPFPWRHNVEKKIATHPAYQRICEAARLLSERRDRELNPPELLATVAARIDAADAFDDVPKEARALVRQSAIMAAAAKDDRLKKRTLTNLYNERPPWLRFAHEQLDRSVLAAYAATDPAGGWSEDWAVVWTETGAGQPLDAGDALAAQRAEVDQKVLANLLRLNHARAKGEAEPPKAEAKPTKSKSSRRPTKAKG